MAREVTDQQGVRWNCVEAYAGLSPSGNGGEAAKVDGAEERFRVVCTPSGGAKSVELELPGGWEESLPDDELAREIDAARDDD